MNRALQIAGWGAGVGFLLLGLWAVAHLVGGWQAMRDLTGGGAMMLHDVHVSFDLGPLHLDGMPAIIAMTSIPLIPLGIGTTILALAWRLHDRSRGHQA